MKILGISGSLRKASWNTALLHAAVSLLPAHELEIAEIGDLPLINQALEQDSKFPTPVERFRGQILAAFEFFVERVKLVG